jgi:predicted amidohydrolase
MRAALLPLLVEPRNIPANRSELETRLAEVRPHKPDLVCLPECTLTGYLYEEKDLSQYAEPVPGPLSDYLAGLAKAHSVFLCAGLLERTSEGVYNTALLFDRKGNIVLHHRKIEEKPPFLCGNAFRGVDTELGRLHILVCGDLFNEKIISQIDHSLDFLLMPMWRSFAGKSPDLERWQAEERQAYLEAVRGAGVTTLIINALEIAPQDASFGGALIVGADGSLLAESPHGTDQLLIMDVET